MGPFFYSKKDIPAKPKQFVFFNKDIFFFDMPPKAIIFFVVSLEIFLNLLIPR